MHTPREASFNQRGAQSRAAAGTKAEEGPAAGAEPRSEELLKEVAQVFHRRKSQHGQTRRCRTTALMMDWTTASSKVLRLTGS